MNKFNYEIFNKDLIDYNIRKYNITDNTKLKLKHLFQNNDNINYLTLSMIRELDLDTSNNYKIIKSKIQSFIEGWINLGKLDDDYTIYQIIDHNIFIAIDHLNQLFINTFKEYFYDLDDIYIQDLNPFRISKDGKLHSEMNMYDIRNMNVQSYRPCINLYEQCLVRDNKIPFYQNLSSGRFYERNNLDGYRNTGDKESYIYNKNYNLSSELLNYNNHNKKIE